MQRRAGDETIFLFELKGHREFFWVTESSISFSGLCFFGKGLGAESFRGFCFCLGAESF